MVLAADLLIIVVLASLVFWLASLLFASIIGAPTVYADDGAIKDAYKLAGLKRGELVIDLGCGDARSLVLAASQFGARGIGVERSPYAYLVAKLNVWRTRQSKNVKIVLGDFKKVEGDLAKSGVVYLYLLPKVLGGIEEWFFNSISKRTRVVSLAFDFSSHKPIRQIVTYNLGRPTKISLYRKV